MSILYIARKMFRLTQLELAVRAGVTQPLIARIEKHSKPLNKLPHSDLARIAAVFGLTADELLEGFDRPSKNPDPDKLRRMGQRMRADKRKPKPKPRSRPAPPPDLDADAASP